MDGAHNPNGAEALRKALDKYYPGKQVQFVFGMMGDKDMSGVIKTLIHGDDVVYTVRADQVYRAAEAKDLAKLVGSNAIPVADLAEAYKLAIEGADSDGVVCVCGSLYLVGEFKKMLLEQRKKLN